MSSYPYETHELIAHLKEFEASYTRHAITQAWADKFRAIAARLETQDRQDAELWQAYNALLRDEQLPNGDYVHALHCNASRRQPVGNGACSCGIGQRIRKILIPAKFGASETPQPPDLQTLRTILEDFKTGTPMPPSLSGVGKHHRAAERREVEVIHKTLNVVLAEIDKLSASRLHEVPPNRSEGK